MRSQRGIPKQGFEMQPHEWQMFQSGLIQIWHKDFQIIRSVNTDYEKSQGYQNNVSRCHLMSDGRSQSGLIQIWHKEVQIIWPVHTNYEKSKRARTKEDDSKCLPKWMGSSNKQVDMIATETTIWLNWACAINGFKRPRQDSANLKFENGPNGC